MLHPFFKPFIPRFPIGLRFNMFLNKLYGFGMGFCNYTFCYFFHKDKYIGKC